MQAPGLAEHRIDERGARMHQRLDRLLREKALLELLVRAAQELAPGARADIGGELRRQGSEQRPRE